MNVTLAMICKNSAWHLARTLDSAKKVYDELVIVDTGSTDETRKIAEAFGAKVYDFTWGEDFSEARNYAFSKASGDAILWLDDDDIVVNPEKLKAGIIEYFTREKEPVDLIYMDYRYEHDAWGNCTTIQLRERVLRNGYTKWVRPIHEVCLPTRSCKWIEFEDAHVKHEARQENYKAKSERNLRIIDHHIAKVKKPEPFFWFYRGNALRELARYVEAVEAYLNYLDQSNWKSERMMATLSMAECYTRIGKSDQAKEALVRAIVESPDSPLPWLEMGKVMAGQNAWEDVLSCVKHAEVCDKPDKVVAFNPLATAVQPHWLRLHAYAHLAEKEMEAGPAMDCVKKAQDALKALVKVTPGSPELGQYRLDLERSLRDLELAQSHIAMRRAYREDGNHEAEQALAQDPPACISDFPGIVRSYKAKGSPKIAFFCGDTEQLWGPTSLNDGIGGSEEAVIHMSHELAKLGWGVEVYASTNFDGFSGGVAWNPFWAYPKGYAPDVFMNWRTPPAALLGDTAKLNCIWLHDLPIKEHWTPETKERIDHALFVSNYHRDAFADYVPFEKAMVTANALHPAWLTEPEQHLEKSLRCIYASSPDRGLETLLTKVWPEILKEEPSAQLDVFYGFTRTFDQHYRNQPKMLEWKQKILDLLKNTKGVNYHGMVPQRDLAKAHGRAHIWIYPTAFGEVSCITAMRAQAMGSIPVTTGFAALAETQVYGVKCTVDDMAREAVKVWRQKDLWAPKRLEMVKWARGQFSWRKVALQWDRFLKEKLALKQESEEMLQTTSAL